MSSVVVWLGVALALGAFAQGAVGFGMAVVAAPFVVVFAPELLPVALLVTSVSLPLLQLAHGPRDIAWRTLGWALAARLLLTPLGVLVVRVMSADHIAVFVGVLILVSVVLSLTPVEVRNSPAAAFAAGAVAGVSGTAVSIGGPFVALVLQHERPPRVRATLSAFFVVGSLVSLGGLALDGAVRADAVWAGLLWLPFAFAGYAASLPVRRHLHGNRLRTAVLVACAVAGLAVIVRELDF